MTQIGTNVLNERLLDAIKNHDEAGVVFIAKCLNALDAPPHPPAQLPTVTITRTPAATQRPVWISYRCSIEQLLRQTPWLSTNAITSHVMHVRNATGHNRTRVSTVSSELQRLKKLGVIQSKPSNSPSNATGKPMHVWALASTTVPYPTATCTGNGRFNSVRRALKMGNLSVSQVSDMTGIVRDEVIHHIETLIDAGEARCEGIDQERGRLYAAT